MGTDTKPSEAGRQYAAAYSVHYSRHDLPQALDLYISLMASHPDTQEAIFSQMQIQNIVNAVVPKQELLSAQVELVRARFQNNGIIDSVHVPDQPLASGQGPH